MVAHTFNPSIQERQLDLCEFEVSLVNWDSSNQGYIEKLCLKSKNNNKNKQTNQLTTHTSFLFEYVKDSRNVKKLKEPSKYIVWAVQMGNSQ